jgi:uncharacterized membrane protein
MADKIQRGSLKLHSTEDPIKINGEHRMNLLVYLKTAAVLFFVDLFWLGTGGIYGRAVIERIQGETISFRAVGGIIVYLFLAYLVLETTSYQQAFLYGLAVYGVYDFTNYTVFRQYDWKFAIADTMWGGILFMCSRYLLKHVF